MLITITVHSMLFSYLEEREHIASLTLSYEGVWVHASQSAARKWAFFSIMQEGAPSLIYPPPIQP